MKKKLIGLFVIIAIIIVVICGVIYYIRTKSRDYKTIDQITYNYYKIYSNGKMGVIDKNANIIIPAKYSDIIIPNPEVDVFFCVENYDTTINDTDYIILNSNQENIFTNFNNAEPIPVTGIIGEIPYEKLVFKYKENNLYGLIDNNGKKVTDAIYEEISSLPYKEGELLAKKDGKYGVINNKGVNLVPFSYDSIIGDGYYNEKENYKLSGYIVGNISNEGTLYGYVNKDGKELLKPEYENLYRVKELSDNIYIVASKNGQYGLIEDDKIIKEFRYQEITYNEDSQLFIIRENKKYGVIDKKGTEILPISFEQISTEGIYFVTENEKYDFNGNKVNSNFNRVEKTSNNEYYLCMDEDYNYGVLDKNLEQLIENKYEYLEYIFQDYFIARTNIGKYGIINSKAETVLEFEYDVVQNVKNTNIIQAIKLNEKKTELYNLNIEKIFEAEDANVVQYDTYIRAYSDTQLKYFDNNGKEVSQQEVYPNNTLYIYNENGKFGFKDKNGNIVIEPNFERVTQLNEKGFAGIKKDSKWGVIDKNGNTIVEPIYIIDDGNVEPDFLGKYYRMNFGYIESLYTDQTNQKDAEGDL